MQSRSQSQVRLLHLGSVSVTGFFCGLLLSIALTFSLLNEMQTSRILSYLGVKNISSNLLSTGMDSVTGVRGEIALPSVLRQLDNSMLESHLGLSTDRNSASQHRHLVHDYLSSHLHSGKLYFDNSLLAQSVSKSVVDNSSTSPAYERQINISVSLARLGVVPSFSYYYFDNASDSSREGKLLIQAIGELDVDGDRQTTLTLFAVDVEISDVGRMSPQFEEVRSYTILPHTILGAKQTNELAVEILLPLLLSPIMDLQA